MGGGHSSPLPFGYCQGPNGLASTLGEKLALVGTGPVETLVLHAGRTRSGLLGRESGVVLLVFLHIAHVPQLVLPFVSLPLDFPSTWGRRSSNRRGTSGYSTSIVSARLTSEGH